ncbi:MAG: DUF5110 domain-containing protein, partial [Lachnospiraceae bacterium]|nr:DUF5110 domain-containing protein [Lachnospiraceae bacterium]
YLWYALDEAYTAYPGGREICLKVDEDSIPRFLREGGIYPEAINQPMNHGKDQVTGLSLLVAPMENGEETSFTLYDDDGISNEFEEGIYRRTKITMSGKNVVTLAFDAQGSYKDPVEDLCVTMIRKDKAPLGVTLDGRDLPHFLDRTKFENAAEGWYYSQTKRAAIIKCKNPMRGVDAANLSVSFAQFDLIGM